MSSLDEGSMEISLEVNGNSVLERVPVRQHLADFLRERLELTGTHLGCEHGICGACTVLLDGRIVRGCLVLAVQASGSRVETIEGLVASGKIDPLLDAFEAHGAAQCAFCSSGMLITAHALVTRESHASRAQIREFISGNLCRCTGYQAIVNAISDVLPSPEGSA
jgi:aerobic-type carbon monoxide dehydrogenase small subunit (CoxS/CutS family)